ncbi:hypothetical protein [Dyadobacter aurulentus]|uniref:hypothetical protein n=1 Tax=Dyadobacter sp. UC 10 TaxID=2605428 RepID=UPI0011F28D6F|nr:hypothetical protein [Dyadobacter sp. UC 10]KAA0992069.1 hypothetical protein FXO21_18760 [Dyadobacter sp. UC 10]
MVFLTTNTRKEKTNYGINSTFITSHYNTKQHGCGLIQNMLLFQIRIDKSDNNFLTFTSDNNFKVISKLVSSKVKSGRPDLFEYSLNFSGNAYFFPSKFNQDRLKIEKNKSTPVRGKIYYNEDNELIAISFLLYDSEGDLRYICYSNSLDFINDRTSIAHKRLYKICNWENSSQKEQMKDWKTIPK